MSFGKFIISKQFFKHALLAVSIIVVLLVGLNQILREYTNQGETWEVPDLKGLNEAQVKRILMNHSMRFEIIDSIFSPGDQPGVVVDQVPSSGAKVKEGRKLFLTINALSPRLVKVPDIKYSSLRQAKSYLKAIGLTVGKLMYAPSENENMVMEMFFNKKSINAGDDVPFGAVIDVVVGRISTDKVVVPSLIGLSEEEAKISLASYSLNLGSVVRDSSVAEEGGDTIPYVFKQQPVDVPVFLGTSVDVWLTFKSQAAMDSLVVYGVNLE